MSPNSLCLSLSLLNSNQVKLRISKSLVLMVIPLCPQLSTKPLAYFLPPMLLSRPKSSFSLFPYKIHMQESREGGNYRNEEGRLGY